MLVFPAIDLLGGNAVRLEQGRRDSATIYSRAPWEIAARWSGIGVPRLHVVDLDAAFARATGGADNNHATIAKIVATAAASGMEVEVGGGVRSVDDCARLFDLGVRQVVIGTAAIKDPRLAQAAFTRWPQRIVVAVDARDGKVSVEAWTESTAATALDIGADVARAGAGAVLYTDISRDGMRTGPNVDATARLARHVAPCPVIASGGVSRLDDIDALAPTGAVAVIIGKALYEGVFTVEEALARAAGSARGGQGAPGAPSTPGSVA